MPTAAEILIDTVMSWGVDTIFGLPGDGINGIVEAIRQRAQEKKLRFIQVRHEESAALMACGHAKFTGKLGCCLATSGPGGIHLLNGLYDAKLDGVPVLAITGLILAKLYGWLWMDPLAGIIGAVVIANWSITLVRDTAGVLLDVCPDEVTRERVRRTIETDGDQVVDLHLWRLGPGHLAAVVAIATARPRDASFYRARLESFACLSHITVEVTRADISRA